MGPQAVNMDEEVSAMLKETIALEVRSWVLLDIQMNIIVDIGTDIICIEGKQKTKNELVIDVTKMHY